MGEDGDIGGSGASRGGKGTDRCFTPHWPPLLSFTPSSLFFPRGLCPSYPMAAPSLCPFYPHSQGLHSWRKRHCSSHCRTGGGTGCSGNACSLLGPVRMRTCTWGSLRDRAGQGCHSFSRPSGRGLQAMMYYWANRPVGQPYQCHFPADTSPVPGLGILGHWCVSSSGNPRSFGLGAAPPTARRKASPGSSTPGPSTHTQWALA